MEPTLTQLQPDDGVEPVAPLPFWDETREALTADPRHRAWYIVVDDGVVGLIGASDVGDGVAQVGYGVTPAVEGRGITTAALVLLLEQLAAEGFRRVIADTFVDHGASRRVMEKCGMRPFDHKVEDVDGEERELVAYEIRCRTGLDVR